MTHDPGARTTFIKDEWGWRLAAEAPFLPADVRRTRPASGSAVVVTSADATQLRGHLARASGGSDSGIVIAPDVRGLHQYYIDLAERFAEAGVHALAFDYFGRTLGLAVPKADFYEGAFQTAPYRAHVVQTTPRTIQEDIRAACARLRRETPARRVFLVGFCFGGRVAFNASAEQPDLSGTIGFYGGPVKRDPNDEDAPILKVGRMRAPVLGLFGGADQGIPASAVEAFDKALTERSVAHKLVTYDGAPHSFFDRTFADNAAACDDAWRRMLAFIRTGDPTAT